MTARRKFIVVLCKDTVYGPFRSEGDAALFLLKTHTTGLLGICEKKVKMKYHTITELKPV